MKLFQQGMIIPLIKSLQLNADEIDFLDWLHFAIKQKAFENKVVGGETYHLIFAKKIRDDLPWLPMSDNKNARRFLRVLEKKEVIKRDVKEYRRPFYAITKIGLQLFKDEYQDQQELTIALHRLTARVNQTELNKSDHKTVAERNFRSKYRGYNIPA